MAAPASGIFWLHFVQWEEVETRRPSLCQSTRETSLQGDGDADSVAKQRHTMSLNASLHIPNTSKNDQATIVDIDAIMDNVSIVLYTLTVVLGITGNSMVIWVAGFKLKPKVTNVWLVNLAIADLIFCFTRVFSLTKKLFFDHWPFGIFLCKFNGFFKYANMFCSVFLLAVISLDRVLCVWQPVFTRRRRTLWAARVVAFCVWTTAIVFSTPYFIHRQVYLKNNLSKCSVDPKEKGGNSSTKLALYSIRFLCGFMLPFMVILICYILAGLGIRRTRLSGKSRPLRILAALVVAFFLCWAPYHCLLLVKMVNSKNPVVKIWHPVASGIAYFNSCVNPLLYFCMGLDMRGRFRQSLAGVYKRALADDEDGQTTQSNDRSMDDSTGSKHTTVVVAGRSQTSVEVAKV
ncbi:formyl peptide receptor 2-like isoform X1 [Siniperca chuatsi]|uniref:formyl peptide receptor 2-like isoform X1 n=1 Tax=Siniperca chuatsi TaxID=119488 RepID=UPI001CE035DB|nr:formyl peptide receptor 2-like isoform X1 [Siniperca chuatsi]